LSLRGRGKRTPKKKKNPNRTRSHLKKRVRGTWGRKKRERCQKSGVIHRRRPNVPLAKSTTQWMPRSEERSTQTCERPPRKIMKEKRGGATGLELCCYTHQVKTERGGPQSQKNVPHPVVARGGRFWESAFGPH